LDIDGFTYGRYYYLAGIHLNGKGPERDVVYKSLAIIEDEEDMVSNYTPHSAEWEIVEDPTGMAAQLLLDCGND
jgi:hypothetical protein